MMSNVDTTLSHEDFEQLCKLRTTAREAEDTYLRAAEEAKRAKKSMEAAQLRVNRLLDELADGPLPLEEQAERNRDADAAGLFEDGDPADEPGTVPVAEGTDGFDLIPEGELWRAVAIDEIFLPPAVLKKLRSAGIDTIGSLAEFSNSGRDLTDIAGIGEETKNVIVDAMIDYFKVNPLPPKPQVVEPETGENQGESAQAPPGTPQPSPDEPAESGPGDSLSLPDEGSEGQPEANGDSAPKKRKRSRKQSPELPLDENQES